MSRDEDVFTRLVARVKALLPNDWFGLAGQRFRAGTQAVSKFAEKNNLLPEDLIQEGVELGRLKLTGLATQEHAAAEKNYAEAAKAFTETEDKKIETELKKRSLEIDISKKEADVAKAHAEARKANAEASLAETQTLDAQFELRKKLAAAGMLLVRDERGTLTILPNATGANLLAPGEEKVDWPVRQ